MEMHQLRDFLAVARTGTFSRAAGECHVPQPSLSQQVQKLEPEVGERLFERTRRRAILTPAGALFLRHALSILKLTLPFCRSVKVALLNWTAWAAAVPDLVTDEELPSAAALGINFASSNTHRVDCRCRDRARAQLVHLHRSSLCYI